MIKNLKVFLLFSSLYCAFLTAQVRLTWADTLEHLLATTQFKGGYGGGQVWFTPGSNLDSLFRDGLPPFTINSWLAPTSSGFKQVQEGRNFTPEYLTVFRIYRQPPPSYNLPASIIKVQTYLPHPKYFSSIELGLLKTFSELKPPGLKVKNTEIIEFGDKKAELYEKEDGTYSIYLELSKQAIISLSSTQKTSKDAMVELLKVLDIPRLERMLSM